MVPRGAGTTRGAPDGITRRRMMRHRHELWTTSLLLGLLAFATAATAQTDACQRYRAELAAIDAGGGRDYRELAERQSIELERMRRYVQSLDCGRGSRFLIFGAPTTPECAEAETRLGAMEENYQRLLAEASRSGNERRFALMTAIEQFCSPQQPFPQDRQARSPYDQLFENPGEGAPWMDGPGFYEEQRPVLGQAVCVRTCDGYFFPLPSATQDARQAAQMCQAQCPAAPTAVFYKEQGGQIEQSFSADGQPYLALPNALSYRASVVETCACRAPGQTWADALAQAETMVGGGGEIVTPERARELSQPRGGAPAPGPAPAIGPVASVPFFGIEEGEWRDVETALGRRRVRVVAPEVIPAPDGV